MYFVQDGWWWIGNENGWDQYEKEFPWREKEIRDLVSLLQMENHKPIQYKKSKTKPQEVEVISLPPLLIHGNTYKVFKEKMQQMDAQSGDNQTV